ncbi:rho GTPase-activating protein 20-like protein [Camelus ferus]|nr:rho GTPase-activating protein 20-like protein [Camelus ferus]
MLESPSIAVDAHGDNASPYEGTQHVVMMFGPAKLQTGWRKKRQLFLYRDKLLISNTKYRWNFKIKYEIPLNNVWTGDCTNKAGEAINAPKSFVLGWPTVNFVATFKQVTIFKQRYDSMERRYIDLAKQKEQPKTIPLKIFTEDINNCASDNQRPPLSSAKPGKLFGAPLGDVCKDDKLPAPVLEMLSIINQKGPLTKRIFLKNASKTSCRALKQRLDSGDTVNMEDESILVLASVLKNIEGGIFTTSLHEKWLSILDDGNEEEKITATRRLLDQLPKANVDLLKHLFGVLHNIEHHSAFNHMTSYNLAQCITPSLLGPPNTTSSQLQEDLTKMVSLVQFLLENCLQLWGEDIPSLCGGPAIIPDEGDVTSTREEAAGCGKHVTGFGEKGSKAARAHGRLSVLFWSPNHIPRAVISTCSRHILDNTRPHPAREKLLSSPPSTLTRFHVCMANPSKERSRPGTTAEQK